MDENSTLNIASSTVAQSISVPAHVEIYSVNGMMVQKQENVTSMGLSVLPSGYYVARIQTKDGKVGSCKIMK